NGDDVTIALLQPGDSFGETGLLEEGGRSATVRATGDVKVLKLHRGVFQALSHTKPKIRRYFELQIKYRHLHNFFRLYSSFARLPQDQLQHLLADLRPVTYAAGELVIRHGEKPGSMYIV